MADSKDDKKTAKRSESKPRRESDFSVNDALAKNQEETLNAWSEDNK